ncbi:preprotein translocase subunit SecG [Roseiconus lacunae]|uniref:Protein-export membrane protein SecG n=1 Tax=Roseiconus lacunae TaxID=2605694 RepID=A0ABT7PBS8_9BACT|nr:preprotein translocase subunit SecG [Roseiconus lacunae]MDM4013937.1 preprotein translocase subunit SecG [Roseiconus lacunae]
MTDSIHCAVSMPFDALQLHTLPLASLGSAAIGWVMFMLSLFLILLILVQRGKGGGLAGALGGPGGQSAFGSKAGDTFTLITAVSAIIWGLVCAVAMYTLGVPPVASVDEDLDLETPPALVSPGSEGAPAGGLGGLGGLEGLDSGLLGGDADMTAADDATEDTDTSENDASDEAATETPSAELAPTTGDAAPADADSAVATNETESAETDSSDE